MKEYKIATGWAIFIYVAALLLISLFTYLLIGPLLGIADHTAYAFMAPLSIIMIGAMILGAMDAYKARLIIDTDEVISISVITKRVLKLKEIAGYRVDENYTYLIPIDKEKKQIKISKYVGNKEEIYAWVYDNFKDLDEIAAEKEEEEILESVEYGDSKEERVDQLNKAAKTSKVMNIVGGVIGAWLLFYPTPYNLAIIIGMIMPLIAVSVILYFKGLIGVDTDKKSVKPSMYTALMFPSLGLFLRSLIDYTIFDYSNVWIYCIVIALPLTVIIYLISKQLAIKKLADFVTAFGVLAMAIIYSFGVVISINCYFDESIPTVYKSKVMEKRISSGKHTSYYLNLAPWGPQKETDEVDVGSSIYNEVAVNDSVEVYFMEGRFNIPWFEVEK